MRCDCHVHIVGPLERYPQLPERSYTAGVASLDTLRRIGAARGIARFVIVQPSFYGTDNSATLDALDALGGDGRGVAVIDPNTTSPGTLAAFHRRGVRGLRVNLYSPIKPPAGDRLDAAFAATAAVAQAMSWHVQVIAPLGTLLQNSEVLARAAVPVVVDHYGLYGRAPPGRCRRPPPARSGSHAACLDQAVGALSPRRRPAEHAAGPRLARGHARRRSGALRLGLGLAAPAAARAAGGRRRGRGLPRDFLPAAGGRLYRRAAVGRLRRAGHDRKSRAALRVLSRSHLERPGTPNDIAKA
jgi:hypothetical protein